MSQPRGLRERITAGDGPKFSPFGHSITINEFHAVVLGFSGLLIGFSVPHLGFALPAYAILGVPRLGSLSHDDPEYKKPIGLRTVRHEPWWMLSSYIPTFFIGTLI